MQPENSVIIVVIGKIVYLYPGPGPSRKVLGNLFFDYNVKVPDVMARRSKHKEPTSEVSIVDGPIY